MALLEMLLSEKTQKQGWKEDEKETRSPPVL